jgi:hypothetical protein
MTLVIKDHIDLLEQFPDSVYQQTLTHELAFAVKASQHRFTYVGCEEGAEPGTVLVHVNVRPPISAQDEDQVRDLTKILNAWGNFALKSPFAAEMKRFT